MYPSRDIGGGGGKRKENLMIKEKIGDKSMANLDFKWNKKCGSLHQYSCFESENHPSNYLIVISFILSLL